MAITGNGTTFSYDGGAVADVLSISTPSVSTATIDTTNIGSIHRTVEIMYDPNSDTDLEDAWDNTATAAPVEKACVITFADAGTATFTFNAILVGFSASVAIDDKVTASLTLRVSGAITVAA